jgi:hypothetical protein
MLWTIGDLPGYEVRARDGVAGHVRDLYFSDRDWRVRYLVIELGSWLHHRRVLVPPEAVEVRDAHEQALVVALSQAEVEASAPARTALPVSAQMAQRYRNYVTWPALWLAAYATSPVGGAWPAPAVQHDAARDAARDATTGEVHLRSAEAIRGHHVLAPDVPIGRLHDFALTDDWRIEDLIVETGSWSHRRNVLVAPYWVERVSWEMSSVLLSVTADRVFACADARAEREATSIRLRRSGSSS